MKQPFEKSIRLPGLFLLFLFVATQSVWAQEDVRKIVGRNVVHTVKSGENMLTIAQRYGLAVDHLAFANGYSPVTVDLPPGEQLIVPGERVLPKNPPRDGLVLNLPERGLYLFRNGQFDRFMPVSIGDEDGFQTPTGQYHIIEKITNPTWYPPAWAKEKQAVGPGPNNPLGTHWIGLSLTRTGIHGTNQPLNVGNSVTHGCIRAYPETIKKLYGDVKVGWPVRIEYETAKLGRGANGRTKLVTFPDVYKKQSVATMTEKLLGGRIPDSLVPLIGLNLGIAMDIERNEALFEEVKRQAYLR
ncbi:MAG: L,D-transpeptidase family protein [Candidatus Eremiobacteraeota bacterium]|nr:L,D-transpeptidase family protein [Candidatus Eremiobacteraeota bacterium]